MTRRIPVWQAVVWSFTALVCWAGLFASLPGYYHWYVAGPLRLQFSSQDLFFSVLSGSASLLCALISMALGTFLYLRKGSERGARFVSFFLLLYGFVMSGPIENLEFLLTGRALYYSARLQAVFFTVPLYMLFLTFPNGVIIPRAFRWLVWLVIPIIPMMFYLDVAEINAIDSPRSRIVFAYISILLILAMGSQVYRYFFRSSPAERQQTKIVLFGIGIQTLLITISGFFYTQIPQDRLGVVTAETVPMSLLWWGGLAVLPVAFTLAIVRSHLWDIDFVIRRTLAYGFLTAALGLLYFGGVILMQALFRVMIGHETPLAIILSTLTIASLFNPLRRAIQGAIDRRFFRRKYDAEQALERFQHTLRNRIDLEGVENELTQTVETTVQPEWVTLWMRKI